MKDHFNTPFVHRPTCVPCNGFQAKECFPVYLVGAYIVEAALAYRLSGINNNYNII